MRAATRPSRANTARRSRACDECARRKIRCGPERPCHSCLQRGIGRFCDVPSFINISSNADSSDDPRPRIKVPMKENFSTDVVLLHERIAELEEQLARERKRPSPDGDDHVYPPVLGVTYDVEELDYSMEHLNLGLPSSVQASRHATEPLLGSRSGLSRLPLPSRDTSTAIVNFSLQQLGWLHCALISPDFIRDHEKFWDAIDAQDNQTIPDYTFTTIYYAILAVGLYYIDVNHEAILNFTFYHSYATQLSAPQSDEDLADLSRYWYWITLQDLDDSDFLGRPRLSTIQVIAILTLLNSSFGQNNREWMLIGVAVNMARMLHLHRLGSEQTVSPSIAKLPQWRTLEQRCLGRRLWWTLVICDWMGVMSHRPTISPHSFDTVLGPESSPDDTVSLIPPRDQSSQNQLSSLHYHQLMARLAGVLRTYVKCGRSYAPKNLVTAMKEIERLDRESPEHLRRVVSSPQGSTLDNEPPWIALQRYLAVHAVQFMRLTIARYFFTQWMKRQPDPEGLHLKACQSAEIIVAEKMRPMPKIFRKSWIVGAATVAAGVFLCLDLLFFSTGEDGSQLQTRRKSVQVCIDALQDMGSTNVVTQRGSVVLKTLLDIQSTWPHTMVPDHDSLRQVIELVIQAQSSESENATKWTRPVSQGLEPTGVGQIGQANARWPATVQESPNQRYDPMATFVPFDIGTEATPLEDSPADQQAMMTDGPGVSSSQSAWDYLMGAKSPISNELDVENMDLGELEGFDNPFQFSDTM